MEHNPKIEVTENWIIWANIYGHEVPISGSTDDIQRFVDPQFDYLRYFDHEQGKITPMWLGQAALSNLVGQGVPETRQRLKMQNCEFQAYLDWQAEIELDDYESEFDE